MRYENPLPDESVNYTNEHPLKEFIQLLVGIGIVTFLAIAILTYFAGALARYIPFEYEQSMVSDIDYFASESKPETKKLQALADRLSVHMELPESIAITLHHNGGGMVNAFATLGGNVVFYEGLLNKLESEQELAAVMAHEIAHVKLRHPIVATGKGLTLATLAAFVTGASGSGAGEWLIGSSINFQLMRYSREQELAADEWAARTLFREYGDISGAKSIFEIFAKMEADSLESKITVEALRSHPYSENRWLALADKAKQENWPITGTPISID